MLIPLHFIAWNDETITNKYIDSVIFQKIFMNSNHILNLEKIYFDDLSYHPVPIITMNDIDEDLTRSDFITIVVDNFQNENIKLREIYTKINVDDEIQPFLPIDSQCFDDDTWSSFYVYETPEQILNLVKGRDIDIFDPKGYQLK